MIDTTRLVVSKKWTEAEILVHLTDDRIEISLPAQSLIDCICVQLREGLAKPMSDAMGNPLVWMTKAATEKQINEALNSGVIDRAVSKAFAEIVSEMKKATAKVVT